MQVEEGEKCLQQDASDSGLFIRLEILQEKLLKALLKPFPFVKGDTGQWKVASLM